MKKSFVILSLTVVALLFWQTRKPASAQPSYSAEIISVDVPAAPLATTASPSTAEAVVRQPAFVARELISLKDMTMTLSEFAEPNRPIRDLVEWLSRTRQEPSLTRDANPYSGEMVIVRTQSPLPGTRYFHAQYFANASNQLTVQHMSFEFRPGVNAMAEARASVLANFPQLAEPTQATAEFVKWNMGNGYNLWIKKMHFQELQEDPFNAYSASDEGTVRVAMEADVHGDEE